MQRSHTPINKYKNSSVFFFFESFLSAFFRFTIFFLFFFFHVFSVAATHSRPCRAARRRVRSRQREENVARAVTFVCFFFFVAPRHLFAVFLGLLYRSENKVSTVRVCTLSTISEQLNTREINVYPKHQARSSFSRIHRKLARLLTLTHSPARFCVVLRVGRDRADSVIDTRIQSIVWTKNCSDIVDMRSYQPRRCSSPAELPQARSFASLDSRMERYEQSCISTPINE